MKAIGVIPARLGSTRLAGKVLRKIAGRPMVQHVWERARQAKSLSKLIVACDDPQVEACVREFGGTAMMTRRDHPNGTSRISEVAQRERADVFVNIQGDEPMIHPSNIDRIVDAFEKESAIKVATVACRSTDRSDYENPNVVKAVCAANGDSLYFSRSPIPCFRDPGAVPFSFLKHLGLYGYRRDFLLEFVTWDPGVLEEREKLEQLRILERGFTLRVIETPYDSWSVDTAEDLDGVESRMKNPPQRAGTV